MPKSKTPNRKRGDTRTVPARKPPTGPRTTDPKGGAPTLRTQIRGGRPPRFPGRTGGR
ncbi:hypothetical protein [uncultured Tateyamaria sp.]|uniref:hypothetical protein n=1 Tax=uncultured Tateyamaria sp. TaxID=455651 RepID=UPI00262C4F10|nr:hypothetical protein [uncultured Tateyamaria sp.]